MINILLCDDHPLVLEGLKLILADEEGINICGYTNNGQEALDFLARRNVDIVMMDINMPVLNGIEALKLMGREFPTVKVIMLSMLNDGPIIKHAINLGCKAYLLKNAGKNEIVETLKVVMEGGSRFDETLLLELLELKKSKAKKKKNSLFPSLSRREKEILSLIIDECTTAEIAEKLFISFGTVETHRRNMLNKLGLKNTAGLVRTALQYDLLSSDA